MNDVPDRCTDYGFCFRCGGIQEAGGDDYCVCQDADEEADYYYHKKKDDDLEG